MTSIFKSKNELRSNNREVTAAEITGTDIGTEVYLMTTKTNTVLFSFKNNTDNLIRLSVVHPEGEDKQILEVLAPGEAFGVDALGGRMFTMPSKTRIFVDAIGGTITSGYVAGFVWG